MEGEASRAAKKGRVLLLGLRPIALRSLLRASPGRTLSYAIPAPLKPRVTIHGHPSNACVGPLHARATHALHPFGPPSLMALASSALLYIGMSQKETFRLRLRWGNEV